MLHISQIEKPRCSAKIDQMRLRRAMNLPLAFQNFSSSGSQCAIQAEFCLPMTVVVLQFEDRPCREGSEVGVASRMPTCKSPNGGNFLPRDGANCADFMQRV